MKDFFFCWTIFNSCLFSCEAFVNCPGIDLREIMKKAGAELCQAQNQMASKARPPKANICLSWLLECRLCFLLKLLFLLGGVHQPSPVELELGLSLAIKCITIC